MMRSIILFSFALSISPLIAQKTQPKIEIIVDTQVEVSPVSVEFLIEMDTPVEQISKHVNDDEYSFNKIMPLQYDTLTGEIDVTSMLEAKNSMSGQQLEDTEDSEVAYVYELMRDLELAGLKTQLMIQRSDGYIEPLSDEMDIDSSLVVVIESQSQMVDLNNLIKDYPCSMELQDIVYEDIEKYSSITYPLLTQKAREQAQILASSMGYDLGKIIFCTNATTKTFEERMFQKINSFQLLGKNSFADDPFSATEKMTVSLNFHFELK